MEIFSDSNFIITFWAVLGFIIFFIVMSIWDKRTDKKRAKKHKLEREEYERKRRER